MLPLHWHMTMKFGSRVMCLLLSDCVGQKIAGFFFFEGVKINVIDCLQVAAPAGQRTFMLHKIFLNFSKVMSWCNFRVLCHGGQ